MMKPIKIPIIASMTGLRLSCIYPHHILMENSKRDREDPTRVDICDKSLSESLNKSFALTALNGYI